MRRRYEEGSKNFFTIYRHRIDEWPLTDNSGEAPKLVASSSVEEGSIVNDPSLWSTLEERYGR